MTIAKTEPPEARDESRPCPSERCEVKSAAGVLLAVVEINERCLGHIVVGELERADLCSEDGLDVARRATSPER